MFSGGFWAFKPPKDCYGGKKQAAHLGDLGSWGKKKTSEKLKKERGKELQKKSTSLFCWTSSRKQAPGHKQNKKQRIGTS